MLHEKKMVAKDRFLIFLTRSWHTCSMANILIRHVFKDSVDSEIFSTFKHKLTLEDNNLYIHKV